MLASPAGRGGVAQAGDGVTRLKLKVAAFHLNGTYVGTQDFAQLLEYCANKTLKSPQQLHTEAGAPRWLRFGVTTQSRFQCDLRTLLASGRGGLYYDPYLVDEGDGDRLFPVPVRVENVPRAGARVNEAGEGNAANDVFTRRFTLFDVFAGAEAAGTPPSAVRYLERAVLRVSIQEDDASRIYPPLLTLRYRERLLSTLRDGGAGAEASVDVRAVYMMPTDGLQRTSTAFLVVGIVLILLAAAARYFVNSRAATAAARGAAVDGGLAPGAPGVVTSADIAKAAIHLCTLFARTFFLILFGFTFVVFLFFKAQGTVFFLLPEDDPDAGTDNEYRPFLVLLALCWACQVIRVLSLLYQQVRPRAKAAPSPRPPPRSPPAPPCPSAPTTFSFWTGKSHGATWASTTPCPTRWRRRRPARAATRSAGTRDGALAPPAPPVATPPASGPGRCPELPPRAPTPAGLGSGRRQSACGARSWPRTSGVTSKRSGSWTPPSSSSLLSSCWTGRASSSSPRRSPTATTSPLMSSTPPSASPTPPPGG